MVLSPQQIASLASNAGFSGNDVVTAVAIALAESSGIPSKYNPEPQAHAPIGKGSYGLWQIYLNAHPQFAGWNLYDPATNATAAFQVYQQQGFMAWTTYKFGQYRGYLNQVLQALAPIAPPAPSPVPATTQPDLPDNSSFVLLPDYSNMVPDVSAPDTSNNVTLYAVGTVAAAGLLIALLW